MRIVCISDTHDNHERIRIPDGDVLIHAGDFTSHRVPKIEKTVQFNQWLGTLPHKHKVVIAGNHDLLFEQHPSMAKNLLTNATYLHDSGIEIEGLKFWGSPYTPYFNAWAFNEFGNDILQHWNKIPDDTDVLITHGPAYLHCDMSHAFGAQHLGCPYLQGAILNLNLKLHVFGHIHEGYGREGIHVNAALMNVDNEYAGNQPIVIDL